jgi:hypothetical protein
MPNKANNETYILEMNHVRKSEEFLCVDSGLQCYNENDDCEEVTVEQISAKHQNTLGIRRPMRMTQLSMNE